MVAIVGVLLIIFMLSACGADKQKTIDLAKVKDRIVTELSVSDPMEVKAEENVKAKSMKTFIENNPELTGIRLSMKNHEMQPWLENIPLYAFRDYLAQRAKPEM